MFEYKKEDSFWLVWFYRTLLFVFLAVILGRTLELQVIKGEYYRTLAKNNSLRRVLISAERGKILARGGEVLATSLSVDKFVVFDPHLGYIKTEKGDDVDLNNAEKIIEWQRHYPLSEKAAHITGYVSEVFTEELGKSYDYCKTLGLLKSGDIIGRGGLEQYYDCLLRGKDGELLIEVDTRGEKVRLLGKKEPQKGKDLKTTVDYKLQEQVSSLFKDLKGAVVVTDKNGEILAFYSSPSFDPNTFILKDTKKLESILKDKNQPLFNRVVAGIYHPGSVFKPLISVAALEEGKVDRNFRYLDTGQVTIETPYGLFSYRNWYFTQYGRTEGEINLTRALARSTDTFFYKVGELLGIENIVAWSRKFGLDKKTGVDIVGEVEGLVPTPAWKLKEKGESWFLGNTYHFSIGQGDLSTTVIGINTAIAAIANGGKLCRPHFVGELGCRDLGIRKESLELVREGMIGACSPGGTGSTFFDFPIRVACKTGTAETGKKETNHAWFTFFAPTDDPQIVATVFVEEGGEGSRVAGPIARKIADFWFSEKTAQ